MALIHCYECYSRVSDKASTCPSCGVDDPGFEQYQSHFTFYSIWLIVFLILGFFGFAATQKSDSEKVTKKNEIETFESTQSFEEYLVSD